ncbi:NAD(P)H-dependent oxidoreductase, partial [Mycobacteroides abscessus]
MSTPLNVVALSGGTSRPSRTLALTEAIVAELGEHLHIKPHLIELGDIARPLGSALWRSELPETVEQQLRLVEKADLLVVTTPVYRGSFTGHFKHLFDLIGQDALVD